MSPSVGSGECSVSHELFGGRFNINIFYLCRDSHYEDEMVLRPSHLYNGNPYTGIKTVFTLNQPLMWYLAAVTKQVTLISVPNHKPILNLAQTLHRLHLNFLEDKELCSDGHRSGLIDPWPMYVICKCVLAWWPVVEPFIFPVLYVSAVLLASIHNGCIMVGSKCGPTGPLGMACWG